MKKIVALVTVIMLILSVCIPVVAAEQAKCIYSYGSFESKTSGVFRGGMRTFQYSEDCAKSGKVSVKAVGGDEGRSNGILWLSSGVSYEKGKTYSVRFYVMSTKSTANIQAQLYASGTGEYIVPNLSRRAVPIGSWGEYVGVFKWTSESKSADLRLDFGGMGDIYIDDLEIYEGALNYDDRQWVDEEYKPIVTGSTAVNLYVDKNASADGDGSVSKPFDSIEAVQKYVRTINSSMTQDIIVNIKGGRYEIERTIELTSADSGNNDHYVIYQPYGYGTAAQEEVVFSGGKEIKGWKESEIPGVFKADNVNIDYLRNLYVNDKRAQRARYNEYVTPISFWDDINNSISKWDGFVIPGGIIKNPEKATNLEIYKTVTFRSNWAVKGKAQTSGDNTIIAMEQPYFYLQESANYNKLAWGETDNFRLENALEFLDEPGEWYHDADTKTLYYMPRVGESIDKCRVVAPDTEQLITIIGDSLDNRAENIIVRGFTFSDGAYKKTSRWGRANLQGASCNTINVETLYGGDPYETEGNIILINAKNISLTDNIIKHMGGSGVMMPNGIDNCEIKGNVMSDISSSAVIVGSYYQNAAVDWRIIPRNIVITNNLIGDVCVEYGTDCGIHGYYTNGLEISHNEIFNTPYSAVSVGWGWESVDDTKRNNVIEYNRIYNFGTACQDGGGIYTLGRAPNSVVRGNYLKAYAQYIVGLYHDSGSSGFVSSDNVVELPADTGLPALYKNAAGDGDLLVSENYASNDVRWGNTAGNVTFKDNHTYQGATRSFDALRIRETAGLESEYADLRNRIDGYSENTQIKRIYLQTAEQNEASPVNIAVGDSLTLKTYGEKKNGEIQEITSGVSYQVMDSSLLELDGNRIKALSNGITTVTVMDSRGLSAMMTVAVGDEVVSCEVITDKRLPKVGELVKINCRLKTKYTEYIGIPEVSDIAVGDTDVVHVTSDGTIKAVGEGKTSLTVNVQFGSLSAVGTVDISVDNRSYRTYKILDNVKLITEDDLLNFLGGTADAKVSEQKYVEMLAVITESKSSDISSDISAQNLTKEKMVAYAADALIGIYGVASIGDNELSCYSDRAQIDSALVSKVALAYRNGLLSWVDGETLFNPKQEMNAAEVAAFLYRFAQPEKAKYIRMEERHFNRYETYCGELYENAINKKSEKGSQWNFEESGEECKNIEYFGLWAGTEGVDVESGELVQKAVRNTAKDTTIATINHIPYTPGKSYILRYSAKLSSKHTSVFASNSTSIEMKFPTTEGSSEKVTASINSKNWQDYSVQFSIPLGTEFTSDSNSILIRFWNSKYDNTVYTVLMKDISITEVADVEITSSSISDGEKNVMVPIDEVYLYAGAPINDENVTVDNFTISGGASIREAEVTDGRIIRVGISGVLPDCEYTLTVSGIGCESGGMLSDTLSWTTAGAQGKSGMWDFEGETVQFIGEYGGFDSRARSKDYAFNGEYSYKVVTNKDTKLFLNARHTGVPVFEVGKHYVFSYAIYSPDKSVETALEKNNSSVFLSPVTVPQGKWNRITGVFSPETEAHATNDDVFKIYLWGGAGTYYLDDIKITELDNNPVMIYRPNLFVGHIPTSGISAGNLTVETAFRGGAEDTEVLVTIAQYDNNDRMVRIETVPESVLSGEYKKIKVNMSNAQNLKTKIFVMGKNDYVPYTDTIVLNKNK